MLDNYIIRSTPYLNFYKHGKDIVLSLLKYRVGTRIDVGLILLSVSDADLVKIEPILAANRNFEKPNLKLSIYKNRRGAYKGIYLWCSADLGTCRILPQFATTWRHELVDINDIRIVVDEDEPAPWNKK